MTTSAVRPPVDVVLVDDHHMFRTGVRASLDERVDVVGEADCVDEAVEVIHRLRPPVVLLDVHLPGGDGGGGAEVIRRCADLLAGTRFLALSVSDAAEDVVGVIRVGARGYVTKAISGPDLTDAVLRVAGGDAVFSPRLAGFVLDAFGTAAGDVATGDDEARPPVGPRARGDAADRARLLLPRGGRRACSSR